MISVRPLGSPLGEMLAVADEQYLYALTWMSRYSFDRITQRVCKRYGFKPLTKEDVVLQGEHPVIDECALFLEDYFNGNRNLGTGCVTAFDFFSRTELKVVEALLTIPWGETRRVHELGKSIGTNGTAITRTIAALDINIVFPTHRVTLADGRLGSYPSGLWRKQWLIEHERRS